MLRVAGRRGFSTFSARQVFNRTLPRAVERPNGSTFTYYRVRFLRPSIFTRRRIISTLFYAVPVFYFCYYNAPFSLEIEYDASDEKEAVKEDGSTEFIDEEDGDLDDEEEGFFLPMTWPKLGEQTFYKGSDPEWREYVKFNKNRERQKRIFSMLPNVGVEFLPG
jgi:hypothetical protein